MLPVRSGLGISVRTKCRPSSHTEKVVPQQSGGMGINMKLYMKQKVFSFVDKFTIKDENENDRYFIQGEFFSWGHKLHVYDIYEKEVAFVKQKVMTFLPKFEVYINGSLAVEVVKEFTLFKPRYILKHTNWSVAGDFWSHNYTVSDSQKEIASIQKAWFTWGDSYEIDIAPGIDELLVTATVLAIDCVLAAGQNAGS